MTREEFLDNVNDWDELLDFCYDNDIYTCEDIHTDAQKDEYIEDNLVEWARTNTWKELYNILDDIPDEGSWYVINDYGEIWEATDDDFEDYKQRTLEKCDDDELFDEEEPYEEDDIEDYTLDEEEEEDEEIEPEMPFAVFFESIKAKNEEDKEFTLKSLF